MLVGALDVKISLNVKNRAYVWWTRTDNNE